MTGRDDTPRRRQVTVTVDSAHVGSIDAVVKALQERGLRVDHVLRGLGLVTGRTADVEALRRVEGVAAVDPEVVHRVPPPDEELQ